MLLCPRIISSRIDLSRLVYRPGSGAQQRFVPVLRELPAPVVRDGPSAKCSRAPSPRIAHTALVPGTTDKGFCDKQVAERALSSPGARDSWQEVVSQGSRPASASRRAQSKGVPPRGDLDGVAEDARQCWWRRYCVEAILRECNTTKGNAAVMATRRRAQPERLGEPTRRSRRRVRGVAKSCAGGTRQR